MGTLEFLFDLLFGNGAYMLAEPFSIIAAALGATAAIAGGAMSGVKATQARNKLKESEERNKAEFMQDYNQDWTNRSDYLAYMRQLADKFKQQDKTNQRMNIVHGATPEIQVAQQQAMSDAYANAVRGFASKASDARDKIKEAYHRREDAYDKAWIDVANQEMKNWSNLAQNGISLAGTAFGNIGRFGSTPKAPTTPTTPTTPKALDATDSLIDYGGGNGVVIDNSGLGSPYKTTGEITAGQQDILNGLSFI